MFTQEALRKYSRDGARVNHEGGDVGSGALLFLGDTVLRNKNGTTTGVRSYTVAGVAVAERVSGTGGGLWWLSPDPVGTVGLRINVASGVVTRRWMDPFGNTRGTAVTWPSLFGYLNAPVSSTGLSQLGARAYDAGLGRFVSVDPLLDTGEPRHANAYSYAYNSPVSYSDPTGLLSVGNRMLFDGGGRVTRPWTPPAAQAPPPPAGNKPPVSTYASGGPTRHSSTTNQASTVALPIGGMFSTAAIRAAGAASLVGSLWGGTGTILFSLSGDSSTARSDATRRAEEDDAASTPATPEPEPDCDPAVMLVCSDRGDSTGRTSSDQATDSQRRTLDDALRQEKLDHVFDPKHNFDPLIAQYGSREAVMEQIVRSIGGPPSRQSFHTNPRCTSHSS